MHKLDEAGAGDIVPELTEVSLRLGSVLLERVGLRPDDVAGGLSTRSRHLSGNRTASAKDLDSVNQWGLGWRPDPFISSVLVISNP